MEVLTHEGFKKFAGIINKGIPTKMLCITFSSGESIKCTPCHEFLLEDGQTFIPASFIEIGCVMFNCKIVTNNIEIDAELVYDLLEVKDTHSFIANNIVVSNCLFLDEFAFVNDAETFYTSVFPVISSGKNSKVIITSTPNGIGNMFYKIWQGAVNKTSDYVPLKIKWQDVPGRDEAWKKQVISNTSARQFSQEHDNEFIGSSNTLISGNALLGLKAIEPIKEHNDVNYYDEPIENHVYVMVVDVSKGRGQDYSTFNIIDTSVSPFNQVAVYKNNNISPLLFPDILVRVAKMYNNCLIIIENNDAGHIVCNAVYHEYEYENTFVESAVKSLGIGVTMTKKIKRVGCSNLKDIIESGKLTINDRATISELGSFEAKGGSYEASGNTNDDLVMNLVMFSWFVSTDLFQDQSSINLKDLLYSERLKEMEYDIMPFGIMPETDENTSSCIDTHRALIQQQQEWCLL